jgi:hypothetical protein
LQYLYGERKKKLHKFLRNKFEDVEKWTKNIPQEGILQVLTDIANDLYTVETFARDVRCGIYTAPKG